MYSAGDDMFNKKAKTSFSDKRIKKEIANGEGVTLVRVNVCTPEIRSTSHRDPLLRHAAPFYASVSDTLCECAGDSVRAAAAAAFASGRTVPFAVTCGWRLALLDESFASVVLEIGFYDGMKNTKELRAQVWERTRGQRLSFSDLFTRPARDLVGSLAPDGGRGYDPELFALTETGCEFFFRLPDGTYTAAEVSGEELTKFMKKRDF